MKPKYKRIALKITGEALKDKKEIFSRQSLEHLANEISSVYRKVELALIIGGGNIVRGRELKEKFNTDPTIADYIGMTATIINALLLDDFLRRWGIETRVMSSIDIHAVAEPFIFKRARRHLEKGRVIILAAGTGKSGVTTDKAAVLLASEIEAEIMMKGTKVDGIYTSDPKIDKDATLLPKLSYREFLAGDFERILDTSAVAQAKMQRLPIFVFNIFHKNSLIKAMCGKAKGTLIS